MSLHAGYAAVLAIDQRVIDGALKAIRPTIAQLVRIVQAAPDSRIRHDAYIDEPSVSIVDGEIQVFLRAWGDISYRLDDGTIESRLTQWIFHLACQPGVSIQRVADDESKPVVASLIIGLTDWTIRALDITALAGGPFSTEALAAIDKYSRLLTFVLGGISGVLPSVELGFLGDLPRDPSATPTLVLRDGAALIGIDVTSTALTTRGDPPALVPLPEDLGVVFHPDAVPLVFSEIEKSISRAASDNDASLRSFTLELANGAMHISGVIEKTGGSVSFAFDAVPHLSDNNFWFSAERVQTDGHLAWWSVVVGIATLGIGIAVGKLRLLWATADFNAGLGSLGPRSSVRRREVIVRPGAAPIDIRIDRADITTDQMMFALSFAPLLPPGSVYVFGSVSVSGAATFQVNLPWGLALPINPESASDHRSIADPLLRIRWTLRRTDTGRVIFVEDSRVSNHLEREIGGPELPLSATDEFEVHIRVYRPLGVFVGEFLSVTIPFSAVDFVDRSHPFVRWTHFVRVPMVERLPGGLPGGSRRVLGRPVRERRSAIHRTHPTLRCRMLSAIELLRPEEDALADVVVPRDRIEYLDVLPFPEDQILARRAELCDYCFFGGPDKSILRT